jgi:uncharacterized protein (DUF2384 family)
LNRKFVPSKTAKLSESEARRQGRVTKLAIDALGAPAAISFLNSVHPTLSDRPLPVAVASEDGLQTVGELIAQITSDAAKRA